jgi:hypothetical protein
MRGVVMFTFLKRVKILKENEVIITKNELSLFNMLKNANLFDKMEKLIDEVEKTKQENERISEELSKLKDKEGMIDVFLDKVIEKIKILEGADK